jgi:hypothetical protein
MVDLAKRRAIAVQDGTAPVAGIASLMDFQVPSAWGKPQAFGHRL